MDLSLLGTCADNRSTFEGQEFNIETLDRISGLPDAILCYILSFLPTKFAAQTEVLSKRWRNVWVKVPTLEFYVHPRANFEGDMSNLDSFVKSQMKSFVNFVDRLLARRGNSIIRKFRLSCGELDLQCLNTWMYSLHDVEELDLEIWSFGGSPWSNVDFTCESLRSLRLSGDILLSIPSTLFFPSLKFLHLDRVNYVDDLSIRKLLSSCPALEDLQITRGEWDNVRNFVISVPTLQRLDLDFNIHEMYLYDSEEDEKIECSLFIDAPKVEHLRLVDLMSDSVIVNPIPYVTEANISVSKIAECDDRTLEQIRRYGSEVCAVFHSVSNVKYLTIGWSTMEVLSDAFDKRLPIFHNLVHLEVEFQFVNDAMLLPTLLEVSPTLETLLVPGGIVGPAARGTYFPENQTISYHWKPPQNVPHCLLYTLKVVEIRRVTGEVEEELKLLKYLLKNAMVLERMTIVCEEFIVSGGPLDNFRERTSSAHALVDRFPFRHDLMNYVRGSAACQLDIQIPEPTILPWTD